MKTRQLVLNKFLQRDRIYYTDLLHKEFETPARENIEWELQHLKSLGTLRRNSSEISEDNLKHMGEEEEESK